MQEKAIVNFLMLNQITKEYLQLPRIIVDRDFDKVYFDYTPYLGDYQMQESGQPIVFELVQNQQMAYWREKDETTFYGEGALLFEIAKDTLGFIYTDDYTLKLKRNSKGEVIGMEVFHKNEVDMELKKLRDDD